MNVTKMLASVVVTLGLSSGLGVATTAAQAVSRPPIAWTAPAVSQPVYDSRGNGEIALPEAWLDFDEYYALNPDDWTYPDERISTTITRNGTTVRTSSDPLGGWASLPLGTYRITSTAWLANGGGWSATQSETRTWMLTIKNKNTGSVTDAEARSVRKWMEPRDVKQLFGSRPELTDASSRWNHGKGKPARLDIWLYDNQRNRAYAVAYVKRGGVWHAKVSMSVRISASGKAKNPKILWGRT